MNRRPVRVSSKAPATLSGAKLPDVTVVVLGKYPKIFNGFVENANTYIDAFPKILVRDEEHIACPHGWELLQGPVKFSMAGNANLGWRAVPTDHDILYVGDDVRFLEYYTIDRLRKAAYSDRLIGLLSPKIIGGADNALQTSPPSTGIVYSERHLALICTYIKREVINKVGYLDDVTFVGYGFDDVDYCRRVRMAGFRLAIEPNIAVQHGVITMANGEVRKGTETFIINTDGNYDPIQKQCIANELAYKKKWNDL